MNFFDSYFYEPNTAQKLLSKLLLPLAKIYEFIACSQAKKMEKNQIEFEIPIICVGNLSLGGNAKTPFSQALASFLEKEFGLKIFIVLRGYKRKSSGLVVVKNEGKILCDVKTSGDEAMEHALFSNAGVIVCEDRICGIKKAIELGATCVILDDAFGKRNIKKFDILLNGKKKLANEFCLPSGALRLPKSFEKKADLILFEGKDFQRFQKIQNLGEKMLLLSAIAKPFRLNEFKKYCVGFKFYQDHSDFDKEKLKILMKKVGATSLLVTKKDYVKLKEFSELKCYLIDDWLELSEEIKEKIKIFIKEKK